MATKHGCKVTQNGVEYLMSCDPRPMSSGEFGAQVVIMHSHNGPALVERRFPLRYYFKTEREAVDYAKGWGKVWICENR